MFDEIIELPCRNEDDDAYHSAYVTDGMGIIQALKKDYFKTFNNLAEIVAKKSIRLLKNPTY